jgi:hypothetical protein
MSVKAAKTPTNFGILLIGLLPHAIQQTAELASLELRARHPEVSVRPE